MFSDEVMPFPGDFRGLLSCVFSKKLLTERGNCYKGSYTTQMEGAPCLSPLLFMVRAYCLATGKTIHDSLADLAIDQLIDPAEIDQPSPEANILASSLSQDPTGVVSWACK